MSLPNSSTATLSQIISARSKILQVCTYSLMPCVAARFWSTGPCLFLAKLHMRLKRVSSDAGVHCERATASLQSRHGRGP